MRLRTYYLFGTIIFFCLVFGVLSVDIAGWDCAKGTTMVDTGIGPNGFAKHNARVSSKGGWTCEVWTNGKAGLPWSPINVYFLLSPPLRKGSVEPTANVNGTITKRDDASVARTFEVKLKWRIVGDKYYAVIDDAFKMNVYVEDDEPKRTQLEPGSYNIEANLAINDGPTINLKGLRFLVFVGDYREAKEPE